MGLVTKTVKVKWTNYIKKHYESLGYIYTKNNDEFEAKVEDLTKGSHVKVSCICDNCRKELKWCYCDYVKQVKENGKTYCKNCGKELYGKNKSLKTKLSKSLSLEQWCYVNNRYDILLSWDYDLNNCSPDEVSFSSTKKCWFKCLKHIEHKSKLKTANEVTRARTIMCTQCNSIGQYIIDNYGEDFLWKVWSNKNIISPFEVLNSSKREVWWNCPDGKHEPYQRSCDSSKRLEYRCSDCVKEKEESIIEEKTRMYLKNLNYKVLTEHNCSIRPINPKTKKPLPFDNEIVLENDKHLIIEVHGRQHYDYHFFMTRKKITKEEAEKELYYQQVKDRYKRIKCIQADYEYLEIPCTTFDNKDTYKKLIDNKIKEILNRRW